MGCYLLHVCFLWRYFPPMWYGVRFCLHREREHAESHSWKVIHSYYMKNTIVQMTKHIIRVCFRVEINHKIETKRSALCSRPVILLQYIYAANIHTFRKGPCLRKIRQCPIGAFHASSVKEWNKKLSSGSLFDSEIHRFQFTKLQTSAVLEKLEWTWLDFK